MRGIHWNLCISTFATQMVKLNVGSLQVYNWLETMALELVDGRTLGVPLAWFPRLLAAKPEQLARYELSAQGIHWDELDEDLPIDGLLAGRADMTHCLSQAA